jgi:hypothetical protein
MISTHTRLLLITGLFVACPLGASAEDPTDTKSAAQSLPPQSGALPGVPGGINDDDPESSVPTPEQAMKNPLNMGYLLMALADRADVAAQRKDHSKEAKYYRAMVKAVPDRSIGYRRACAAHDLAHELDKAIEMCRGTLGAGGVTIEDHLQFLRMLLKKPTLLSATEIADADAVVARLKDDLKLGENEAGRKLIADAQCQIGAKLEDAARLEGCITELRELKAEPAKLHTFEWARAVAAGDVADAQEVIEQAREAGLPPAALFAMERGLEKAKEVSSKQLLPPALRKWWPALLTAGLLVLALIALKARRSRPQAV